MFSVQNRIKLGDIHKRCPEFGGRGLRFWTNRTKNGENHAIVWTGGRGGGSKIWIFLGRPLWSPTKNSNCFRKFWTKTAHHPILNTFQKLFCNTTAQRAHIFSWLCAISTVDFLNSKKKKHKFVMRKFTRVIHHSITY